MTAQGNGVSKEISGGNLKTFLFECRNTYTHHCIWIFLERSPAKSLGKLSHSVAASLPWRLRLRFNLVACAGLGSCKHQHSGLTGPREGPLATEWGQMRMRVDGPTQMAPFRRVPPRPSAASKCYSPHRVRGPVYAHNQDITSPMMSLVTVELKRVK